jgi:hypothetical protein
MDKGRHPQVIRTWTVERTKTHYRPPQAMKLRPDPHQNFRGPSVEPPHAAGSAPAQDHERDPASRLPRRRRWK